MPREVGRRFMTCEILLQLQKRSSFLHRILPDEKNSSFTRTPNAKNIPFHWPQQKHPRIQCDVLGVIYYELLKRGESFTRDRYRAQLKIFSISMATLCEASQELPKMLRLNALPHWSRLFFVGRKLQQIHNLNWTLNKIFFFFTKKN